MDGTKKEIIKISWDESIWFADIDDTLINTAEATTQASEGIRKVFASHFGNKLAKLIQDDFLQLFNIILADLRGTTDSLLGGRETFNHLWKQIEDYQTEIKKKYKAVKKYSREVFIKICCDKEKLKVAPELIYEAANEYWMTLSTITQPLPGVAELSREIKKHNRPFYLISSSDARLCLKNNNQFEYIPQLSEDFKMKRVELLHQKGIDFNAVSIGDPEDKPHLDFFEKSIKKAETDLGEKIDLSKSIIIGDSFTADLKTPKEKMGFGLVVLYQKGKANLEINDPHQITTGNIFEIVHFLT